MDKRQSIKDALETRKSNEKYACVGYINIAKNEAGVEKDYRILVGLPSNYMPECPMRTMKLSDFPIEWHSKQRTDTSPP